MASPEAPTDAPNISFAIPAPIPKHPWPRFPNTPGQAVHSGPQVLLSSHRHQPTPPPTPHWPSFWNGSPRSHGDARTKSPTPSTSKLFRHCGANATSPTESLIREQWAWVRSHAPSLPGIAEVLHAFLASPPPVQQIVGSPAASPAEAEAANQAEGAAKKKGYTP